MLISFEAWLEREYGIGKYPSGDVVL